VAHGEENLPQSTLPMSSHPAIAIFRAVIDELILTEPNWRACSLDEVKARFVSYAMTRRRAAA